MQKKSPRHLARSLAVQGIYFYKVNHGVSIAAIEDFLYNACNQIYIKANYELMHSIINGCISDYDELAIYYQGYLTRKWEEVNLVEQIILVIAAFELLNNPSVPSPVIINEAVELAKIYGAEESYKFINGLVDKLAGAIRNEEMLIYKNKKFK